MISSVSNNENRPVFVVCNGYRALLTFALMPIKQYTVFRCFFSFLQNIISNNFNKTLFFTIHALNIKGKPQNAYTICWYRCTADPLRRQCIWVRAHKKYLQSSKNKFCMPCCKPSYLSITKNRRDFAQNWIFYRQFLAGYSFANCTVCVSFFFFFFLSDIFQTLICVFNWVNYPG